MDHSSFARRSRVLLAQLTTRIRGPRRGAAVAVTALLATALLVPVAAAPAAAAPVAAAPEASCTVEFTTTESEAGFTHPGVGLTAPVLENARTQIAAGAEPWTSYYESMLQSGAASLTAKSANESTSVPGTPASDAFDSQGFNSRFIADGLTSYTQALLYVLTGNEQYRANALGVIRIWEQMDPAKYEYFTDSHIHTGIPMNRMVTAAELLRYSSCADEAHPWTVDDTSAFTENLVTPVIETFQHSNNYFMNQHNYPLLGAMAGYIFTDDKARYDEAVEWFTVNSTANDQGFNGSIERLFRLVDTNDKTGEPVTEPYVQHVEMGRDQAHGGGDITNATLITRMLLAQNTLVDPEAGTVSSAPDAVGPFEFLDDRILAAADYFWQYALGYDTPWTPVAYAISPDGTIRDTYNQISPSYKGRFNTANFWDMYYYYAYQKDVDLETVAPHFYQAFQQRLPLNFYYGGSLNQNWNNVDGGGDFWLYIPSEAAGSSLPVPQASPTVLELEDRYSALSGTVTREAEGDATFLRSHADTAGSTFAFMNGSTAAKQVGLRVRTDGAAELTLRPGVAKTVFVPDTHGEWTTLIVSLGENDGIGDSVEFTVTGGGAQVDLDALDVAVGASLSVPTFADSSPTSAVSYTGATVSLDLSATDPGASDVLSYQASGLPDGASLDPATGLLTWQAQGAADSTAVIAVTDGAATVTTSLHLRSAADRTGALQLAADGFDASAVYVAASKAAFEAARDAAAALEASGSDAEFVEQLQTLAIATGALQLVSPRVADGTLDYPALLSSSTVAANTVKLVDGDNQSGSSYTQAQNLSHTFDFGPDFRVSASGFGFQSNIFSDRLASSAVFGSNDGVTWTRLTPEVTAFTQDYQTLAVAPELADEQFRLIRVQLLDPQPDVLYGTVRNMLEMTEFHIDGERHEIGNELESVSLSAPAAVAGLIDLGDVAILDVVAKHPLQSVTVKLQGIEVAATSDDGVHWTASAVLTDVPAGPVAIAVDYVGESGEAGATAAMSTDGSRLLLGGEGAHRIDVATLATVTASDRQWPGTGLSATEVGRLLFDGDASTAGDLNTSVGSNYVVDFGEGLAVRPESVLVLPRPGIPARANGTVLQGSADGSAWTDLSVPIAGAVDGQWSTVTPLTVGDGESYRYLRITNPTAWSGNLAEVVLYGDAVYTDERFDGLVASTATSTRGSSHSYAEEVEAIRAGLADEEADRTALLHRLLSARGLLVPLSTLQPLIAVDRSRVVASSVSWDNTASAEDNGWRAFDGDPATSPDTKTGSGWVRVDLGEGNETAVASVRLLPRAGNVGRLNGAQLQGSNDGTTFTTFGTVSGAAAVKWYTVDVADPQSYRYLRYSTPNGFANVAEIEWRAAAIDATLLDLLISRGESLAPEGYTADSFATLKSALDAGRAVRADAAATQEQVDTASQAALNALEGLVPVVEEPEGPATSAPGVGALSNTSGWATGLADGNFDVALNLWWGSNATRYELYENGVLISSVALVDATPAAQNAVVPIRGRSNGEYVYTGKLINRHGSTETSSTTVTVTNASPGVAVLSSDNWSHGTDYTVSFNLWWGTNATAYRLYENDQLIDSQELTAASPGAQSGSTALTGREPGDYVYRAELENAAGVTTTAPITVTVG